MTETVAAYNAGHCPTCRCDPPDTDSLVVYAPNERFWGCCETCGQVRWGTDLNTHHRGCAREGIHCACCTHPHDLKPGGHTIPTRGGAGV